MKKSLFIFILFISLNCEANFLSPALTSLTCVQEDAMVFHGSPYNFDKVQPHYSERQTKGNIMWQGEAIFATPDYRIALFYTHNRYERLFNAGIDLVTPISADSPITYAIYGGQHPEEALDRLFGRLDDVESSLGFIYLLRADAFRWEEGLGAMECVCDDPSANVGQICVNRREEIQKLIDCGRVKLEWKPSWK